MRLLETWHARRCNQTDASRIAGQSVLQKVLHAAWHTAFVPRRDRGMGWQTRINILMAISRERDLLNHQREFPRPPTSRGYFALSRKIREKRAGSWRTDEITNI